MSNRTTRWKTLTSTYLLVSLVAPRLWAQPAPDEPVEPPVEATPSEEAPPAEEAGEAKPGEGQDPRDGEAQVPSDGEPEGSEEAPSATEEQEEAQEAPSGSSSEPARTPESTEPAAEEPAQPEPLEVEPLEMEPLPEGDTGDEPEDLEFDLDEVTVSGSRLARAPGSAHVVGERQLERFEYDDPQAVLLQVPGVYVRQEDGVGLRPNIGIRGVSPDRSKKLTLMEDGILFGPAPYSAPAAYYFPLLTRMTQVRVIKGPSAIAYGPQTVGGAIDFISRAIPTRTAGALDVGVGDYGYNKVHAHFGSHNGQTGFLVEGVRLQNTGFMALPNGADTGSTRHEWVVKASHVLDPKARALNEFRIKFTYSDEVSNETYLGQTDADFRRDPYRRYAASALDQMKNHRTGLVLTHVLDIPDSSIELTTSAYRNEMTRSWNKLNRMGGASASSVLADPRSPQYEEYYGVLTGELDSSSAASTLFIGPNARDFISQGVQTKLDWRTESGPLSHRVEAGLRLHHDAISRRHSETGYLMADGRLIADGEATRVTQRNEAATHALALHALDAISWKQLTVTPGVRMELLRAEMTDYLNGGQSSHFVHAILPGIGAFYGFTDEFGVLAGVHRGFSPPAPPAPNGTVDSGPEYSVNYEAGARYKDGPATFELIGFFSDYSNLTSICTFAGGCVNENFDRQFDAGAAHIYGLEAFAGHELPAGPVTVPFTVAYTLTQSEFLNAFTSGDPTFGNVQPGYHLPYLPQHQLVATVGAETKTVGGMISANYISRMREIAGDEPLDQAMATDAQFWIDAGISVRALKYLTVYGNLRNVLGGEYIVSRRPYGARPNPPRWFQVGAKFEF